MTEFSFPCVSVASSDGEYFQISFAESEESEGGEDTDRPYFLIQRQFESYDGGLFYLESHETRLCGHFKILLDELAAGTVYSQNSWTAARGDRSLGMRLGRIKGISTLRFPGVANSISPFG
jgi:hypothetical protein